MYKFALFKTFCWRVNNYSPVLKEHHFIYDGGNKILSFDKNLIYFPSKIFKRHRHLVFCLLCTDDEILYWQWDCGSKLAIVSRLIMFYDSLLYYPYYLVKAITPLFNRTNIIYMCHED
jgi:hypothetical protein